MSTLQSLRGLHLGKRMLVCGLGPSIKMLQPDHGLITIGVNDIARHLTPTYHLLQDRPESFAADRLEIIVSTRPKRRFIAAGFEHLWREHFDEFVRCGLHPISSYAKIPHWEHGGQWLLHSGGGTPFVAASLAGLLGAKEIGLVGVDMIGHPRLKQEDVEVWNLRFAKLVEFMTEQGITLVNLSPMSAIDRVPFADWGLLDGIQRSPRTAC